MIIISCKNGRIFQGMNENYIDAEMKLSIAYYKAQGCIIETVDSFKFGQPHDCEHCDSLEHDFEGLIDEIKKEG